MAARESRRRAGSTDVIVVGAGHAGLAMSYELKMRGIGHVVLERGEVANTWRRERWNSLRLLTPNWMCRLPGQDYDGDGVPDDAFPTLGNACDNGEPATCFQEGEIVCSADEGAVFSSRQRLIERQKRADYGSPTGAHGYDNKFESMRAMFVAHGRAFKKGKVVDPFPNVDIYEIMCRILKLKPAKNDGNFSRVKGMLR